ncbi:hypothetical protein BDV96DRAFT_568810 [Lophiotrema nucula]|uniref:Uncharacterized protein n=1 Tax=Lophiotrema nucula TaxID=690887 RepID=A0A6A5ZKI6_9PLEO|nr:hypothetical protein BDV96DRAFT_568810 [Lophiotrema nucula]
MADEMVAGETPVSRTSRFKEGTMNSTLSIHPPPTDVYWTELAVPAVAPPIRPSMSSTATNTTTATASSTQSAFGRFSRAIGNFFQSTSFSGLGKRKADQMVDKENQRDDRKEAAERAYQEAKELGLLPQPKVFHRPIARPRPKPASSAGTPIDTPLRTLRATPSKKDLQKQVKLSRKVSDLEHKLAEAKRELTLVLSPNFNSPRPSTSAPPLPPTPNSSRPSTSPSKPAAKITKKRKASRDDEDNEDEEFAYKPVATEEDSEFEASDKPTRKPSKKLKRSSRLAKKKSNATLKENVMIVVPDGVTVPPLPEIPNGVAGKRVAVSRSPRKGDDGYGGLEHEMF